MSRAGYAQTLPLTATEIKLIDSVSRLDWSQVEPAVFGTLFERGLDPGKRAQLGAHYTDRRSILRLIEPVLMEPLRRDEGFYYRALESARCRGREVVNRFFTFFGKLVEAYCVDLTQSVYGNDRPIGGGRVHGEQRYGRRGGKRTSDVAIDLGLDLVLVEVVSARHTELLWDRIDAELPEQLRGGRVQQLTVLDIEDFELLLGLVSDGWQLPDVLRRKAEGAYRRLGLARFMHEELHLPLPLLQRPPVLEQRWEALGEAMKEILFPADESGEEARKLYRTVDSPSSTARLGHS